MPATTPVSIRTRSFAAVMRKRPKSEWFRVSNLTGTSGCFSALEAVLSPSPVVVEALASAAPRSTPLLESGVGSVFVFWAVESCAGLEPGVHPAAIAPTAAINSNHAAMCPGRGALLPERFDLFERFELVTVLSRDDRECLDCRRRSLVTSRGRACKASGGDAGFTSIADSGVLSLALSADGDGTFPIVPSMSLSIIVMSP